MYVATKEDTLWLQNVQYALYTRSKEHLGYVFGKLWGLVTDRAELALTPIDFLRRLATLIPPPFAHLTRYHGVFAPNHHLRAAIVPASAIAATGSSRPASRRRLDWASLLKRGFATDVLVCDACGGAMRILAILPDGDASRAILEHLG